jgi:hypothetical protein
MDRDKQLCWGAKQNCLARENFFHSNLVYIPFGGIKGCLLKIIQPDFYVLSVRALTYSSMICYDTDDEITNIYARG